MIKRIKLKELSQQNRVAEGKGFTSYRYILQDDNMGFTVCRTEVKKGGPYEWHYPYHKESCLCIAGHGIITDQDGVSQSIHPGDMYVLDKHQKHTFEAIAPTVLISIFNPPLTGLEVHDENNEYPENPMVFQRAKTIFAIANNEGKTNAIEKIKKLLV